MVTTAIPNPGHNILTFSFICARNTDVSLLFLEGSAFSSLPPFLKGFRLGDCKANLSYARCLMPPAAALLIVINESLNMRGRNFLRWEYFMNLLVVLAVNIALTDPIFFQNLLNIGTKREIRQQS